MKLDTTLSILFQHRNPWLIWTSLPIFIRNGVLVIVWLERERSAALQQRPQDAGPRGMIQALADGTKEDLLPSIDTDYDYRIKITLINSLLKFYFDCSLV